ncbi:chemotaxis response regulator protein-glutamate methylesterase CheB [Halorhodospira halochloris]|uniref:Protein-glutamate methylesterase/protein-glutamine glutaminase n=1 Tax=Halorhodospira halochloris TaxID=1052 RepID=A0A110B5Z6_HALHR|nr:chemotaxis response regulator protein-glutamate methylesterase [Halorhodospira halochloris]MBK1651837.1 chemotaxis response regulator protein-glutamate methylesterase [Halorhodospira halochloris]BAU58828.1 chemotaxis response regulator protein-glutamate methylesterase CheB [Halorhodospira halochloris]
MSIRVLVVDDSGFFRRRIRAMVESHPKLHVCGEATNGKEAITLTERLCPDVITMDIEMPELDGISAVREIMRRRPTPVLMFSSLTYEGAKSTLEALEAGASDFIPKRFADVSGDSEQIERQLCDRLVELGGGARGGGRRRGEAAAAAVTRTAQDKTKSPEPGALRSSKPVTRQRGEQEVAQPPVPSRDKDPGAVADRKSSRRRRSEVRAPRLADLEAIVIGCSTGGPVALQQVLTALPANFPVPILAVQHMPASFTPAFAERLNELCRVTVREAQEGDVLRRGEVLLAPGGKHIGVRGRSGALTVYTHEGSSEHYYKPSVDIAFAEIARLAPGGVLGIVLTGMGSDGAKGAKVLKDQGSWVWSQDEATSVIYGMPAAVAKAGLSDQVLPLDQIGIELSRLR